MHQRAHLVYWVQMLKQQMLYFNVIWYMRMLIYEKVVNKRYTMERMNGLFDLCNDDEFS